MIALTRNGLLYYKCLVGKYLLKLKMKGTKTASTDVILVSWLLTMNKYLFLITFEQRFDHCNISIASTDNFEQVFTSRYIAIKQQSYILIDYSIIHTKLY